MALQICQKMDVDGVTIHINGANQLETPNLLEQYEQEPYGVYETQYKINKVTKDIYQTVRLTGYNEVRSLPYESVEVTAKNVQFINNDSGHYGYPLHSYNLDLDLRYKVDISSMSDKSNIPQYIVDETEEYISRNPHFKAHLNKLANNSPRRYDDTTVKGYSVEKEVIGNYLYITHHFNLSALRESKDLTNSSITITDFFDGNGDLRAETLESRYIKDSTLNGLPYHTEITFKPIRD